MDIALTEQQQRDDAVWCLLLSRLWQPEAHVLCKLMCCSNSMAALVHSTCAGRLSLSFRCTPDMVGDAQQKRKGMPSKAMSFRLWLLRNCCLVQDLEIKTFGFEEGGDVMLASSSALLESILSAAAPLQQLKLTDGITEALMDSFAPALKQLAHLTSLSISYTDALGSLQPFLQQLPPSLVSLDLIWRWEMHTYEGQRQNPSFGSQRMQHLTALKSLSITDTFAGDVMAPALTALTVHKCHDIEPVVARNGLKQLNIARVLQSAVHSTHQLSRLMQLQDLSLNCGNSGTRGSCRYPACSSLKRLKLRRAVTSKPVITALSQTRQLTALEFVDVEINKPEKLSAALQQLQGLQVWKLSLMPCAKETMHEVLAGMAELTSLRQLTIAHTNLAGTSCTEHLARCTQLQHVALIYCFGIDEAAVSNLRVKLPSCKCVLALVTTVSALFYEASLDYYRHSS